VTSDRIFNATAQLIHRGGFGEDCIAGGAGEVAVGGLLDRLDSLLFAFAPAYYYAVWAF